MRSCSANACSTGGSFTAVTLSGGASLPGWITSSSSAIAIAPTDGSVKASNDWVVVVTWTPTEGSNSPSYTAVTITVSCEITSFTIGNTGTTSVSYDVFDKTKIIDASAITYTQSPACGYTYSSSYSYTIPSGASSVVSQGSYLTPSFEIYSQDTSKAASYSLVLTNTITVDGGQGQSTTTFGSLSTTYSLTVTDPCPSATVSSITFSPSSITVTDGSTATSEFAIPGDSVDTSAAPLTGLCGTKTYEIKDSSNNVITTWATITDSSVTSGGKTLTINPDNYGSHISSQVSETLTVTTKLADYTGNGGSTTTIAVTINPISCDCSLLAWGAPSSALAISVNVDATTSSTSVPDPTADTSARSTSTAFDACYQTSNDCATTGSYGSGSIKYDDGATSGGVTLPSWITWNDGTSTLTVAPDNVSYTGSHTLLGTFTPTHGTAAQFTVVTITVNCVVTSVTRPSNPTTGLTFILWGDIIYKDFTQTWT